MFTQDFFTENATHKQNCTSFDPQVVITYNVNNGKPFLNVSRSNAHIQSQLTKRLVETPVIVANTLPLNVFRFAASYARRGLFYHSSIASVRPDD
ncbi:MAG TPA: hypothetical protein DDY57_06830 [Franconibacter pulveris]|nr:hypothetical protein [Franconibacter pulveris]